jgi:hypothetical protein
MQPTRARRSRRARIAAPAALALTLAVPVAVVAAGPAHASLSKPTLTADASAAYDSSCTATGLQNRHMGTTFSDNGKQVARTSAISGTVTSGSDATDITRYAVSSTTRVKVSRVKGVLSTISAVSTGSASTSPRYLDSACGATATGDQDVAFGFRLTRRSKVSLAVVDVGNGYRAGQAGLAKSNGTTVAVGAWGWTNSRHTGSITLPAGTYSFQMSGQIEAFATGRYSFLTPSASATVTVTVSFKKA